MSLLGTATELDFPESNGMPMGETDLHRDWMTRILDVLRYRYQGERVYVASNLLVYYDEDAEYEARLAVEAERDRESQARQSAEARAADAEARAAAANEELQRLGNELKRKSNDR